VKNKRFSTVKSREEGPRVSTYITESFVMSMVSIRFFLRHASRFSFKRVLICIERL